MVRGVYYTGLFLWSSDDIFDVKEIEVIASFMITFEQRKLLADENLLDFSSFSSNKKGQKFWEILGFSNTV